METQTVKGTGGGHGDTDGKGVLGEGMETQTVKGTGGGHGDT